MTNAFQIMKFAAEQALDNAANVLAGATLTFTLTGTSTPTNAFSDSALTTPLANPLSADAAGAFVSIFLDPTIIYKIVLKTSGGAVLKTWDPANEQLLTAALIGFYLYPRTAGEISASITPVNYAYPPGHVFRYATTAERADIQSGSPILDVRAAIQMALDSGETLIIFPAGFFRIGGPLYIRATSVQNLTLAGEGRTNSYILPAAVSIADGVTAINTMIFNQADNGKLCIRDLRFWANNAYTGLAIYCKEGGGANASGQAIFSGYIERCWFDHNSTSVGVLRGAMSNFFVTDCTFEFMKGCFYRDGAGMGDVVFLNNVMSNCYDAFYDGMSDTTGDNIVTIDNLHVYTHNRGQVIQTQNSNNLTLSNITVQAASPNLGTVGLFSLKNCTGVLADGFNAAQVSVFGGSGLLGEVITIEGTEAVFSDGIINIPDVGIRITGTSSSLVEFNGVHVINALTCSFRVQTGTPTGRITARNCNWSDSQNNIILFSNAAGFDFFLSDCRIMNSGLGASAGSRNLNINCSGRVRLTDCEIGQNNGAAAGAYYIDASGAGTLTLVDALITGTPPTGFNTGTQAIIYDGATGTWTPTAGGTSTYTVQQGTYSVKSKCVTFWGRITVNAIGTGSATTLNGLPFTNNANYYGCGVAPFFATLASNVTSLHLTVSPSTSQVVFRTLVAAAAATGTANVMQNGTDIIFNGSYQLP